MNRLTRARGIDCDYEKACTLTFWEPPSLSAPASHMALSARG